jgi:4a-hydroxytetrahydrobiopterin dehydratase
VFTSLTLLDVRSGGSVPTFAEAPAGKPAYAHAMEKPISRTEAEQRVKDLPGWELAGDSIARQFTFAGFPEAIAFVVRLGFAAEAADHHPDMLINYKRVRVTYSTHSAGGLTDKDFAGAAAAMSVAESLGAK